MKLKRFIVPALIAAAALTLVGCKSNRTEVIATVIATDYNEPYTTSFTVPAHMRRYFNGKVWQTRYVPTHTGYIEHPEEYLIYIRFGDRTGVIDDKACYQEYEDKIGQTVTATLQIKKDPDGSYSYEVIEIKSYEGESLEDGVITNGDAVEDGAVTGGDAVEDE